MNNLLINTYTIELRKLAKRKDTLLLWLMPLLSLFYAIGVATYSPIVTYAGTDKVDALSFLGSMFVFSHGLFIFYIILAIITARSLGSEIEDQSLLHYIPRIRNRNTIYNAKYLSLITAILISFLVFALVSVIAYYTLVVQRTDIANGLLFSPASVLENLGGIISVGMAFVFCTLLVLMLSTRFKPTFAVCIFLFAFVVLSFVAQFPFIQYLSPFYYVNSMGAEGANVMLLTIASLVLSIFYSMVFCLVGKHVFAKKDL